MDFSEAITIEPYIVKLLNNAIKKDRLVQVFLFEGASGTPKVELAYYLAALLLCEGSEAPCGECISCIRIKKDIHPRIFHIKPDGANIKKEQIDNLEHEFFMTSLEEGKRIFIIEGIDKATPAASNALLKFLEETREGNYGVLITDNALNVLSTIRSRAQILSFAKLPFNTLVSKYQTIGVENEISNVLAIITNDFQEGMNYITNETFLNIVDLVKALTKGLFNGEDLVYVMSEKGRFLIEEQDKKYHNLFLDLLITITNDRLYYLLGKEDEIVFERTIKEIDDVLQIPYDKTFNQVEKLLKYKQRIRYNVNLELMYMEMLIEMMR